MTEQNYSNVSPERIEYAGRHAYITPEPDAKPMDEETRIVAAARAAAKLEGKNRWLTFKAIAKELIGTETDLYTRFARSVTKIYLDDAEEFAEWLSWDVDKYPKEGVDVLCATCGEGDYVEFKAYADWNPGTQQMQVKETDEPFCSNCDSDCNTVVIPIAEGKGKV